MSDEIIDIGMTCMKGSKEFAYSSILTMIKLANNPERSK